ncbi:hypothetical protein C2G38_2184699 [Gigaspora rosea]|uniref:Uncharacterized protein n=1 Tax=Gigaspora rosea TaxID=44941 RepID=A0A397VAQ5_9GLOM|nr:hypothetical protein C2G38_2184699 [Gigaspora rosea]
MRPVQDQITRKCDSKFTKKKRVRRKQNDKQTKNTNISTSRNDSTTFESSVETIAVGKNQRNEESMINIDPNTRSYIDSTIQASTVSMMQQLQQLLNQQAEAQSRWNAQLLETINQKLTHVNQPNSNNDNQLGTNPNNIQQENNLQRIINLNNNNGAVQGNYPPTPVNNNLILASGSEDQGNEPADKSKTIIYKATGRKFPSFVYTFKNNIQVVQGFLNEKNIETEQIHLYIREDTVLQTSEGGVVIIKKQKQNILLENISDWLIAFKAYMDAVLIIYGNRELELNTYWDHINELCATYKFSAIMAYDEDPGLTQHGPTAEKSASIGTKKYAHTKITAAEYTLV